VERSEERDTAVRRTRVRVYRHGRCVVFPVCLGTEHPIIRMIGAAAHAPAPSHRPKREARVSRRARLGPMRPGAAQPSVGVRFSARFPYHARFQPRRRSGGLGTPPRPSYCIGYYGIVTSSRDSRNFAGFAFRVVPSSASSVARRPVSFLSWFLRVSESAFAAHK
jgi:hypothetical protein